MRAGQLMETTAQITVTIFSSIIGIPLFLSGSKAAAKRSVKPAKNQVDLPAEPLRGEARGVQIRSESDSHGSTDILTFRVERFDEKNSDRLPPIPVEIVGTIRGVLNEGDKVEINAEWQTGQTLKPQKILNVTTGGDVGIQTATPAGRIFGYAVLAFIALGFVVIIGFIIYSVINGMH